MHIYDPLSMVQRRTVELPQILTGFAVAKNGDIFAANGIVDIYLIISTLMATCSTSSIPALAISKI